MCSTAYSSKSINVILKCNIIIYCHFILSACVHMSVPQRSVVLSEARVLGLELQWLFRGNGNWAFWKNNMCFKLVSHLKFHHKLLS